MRAQGRHQARADRRRARATSLFACRVAKHVKSNAIVYAKDGATVGIGAGQMSRVDSARIAARKARGCRAGSGLAGAAHQGLGGRLGCLLPLRRRPARRDRGRRHRRDPAGRLDARRRGDRRRRRRTASPWCSPACGTSGIRTGVRDLIGLMLRRVHALACTRLEARGRPTLRDAGLTAGPQGEGGATLAQACMFRRTQNRSVNS